MDSQSLKIHGYWLSLLPMGLFVLGVSMGIPWLVVVFFFGLMPLVRLCLKDDVALPPEVDRISNRQFRLLRAIPWAQVALWALLLPWSMFVLRDLPSSDVASFVLSLWVVMSLNFPVVHEMLHSRLRRDRIAARIVAGSIGYFQMLEEHKSHHATNGVQLGDSAQVGESLYVYAAKRYVHSFAVAWRWELLKQARRGRPSWNNRIVLTALVTILVMVGFGLVAGWRGVMAYIVLILSTSFSFQAITYIQHWGLTHRAAPELAKVGYSWEDRCWVQACTTLNVAYHGHHHKRPGLPYYQLSGLAEAPQLPASYPVMFLAALLPPVFERVMRRRLEQWLAGDGVTRVAKNRSCAGIDELLRA